jgi:hypothetical protein
MPVPSIPFGPGHIFESRNAFPSGVPLFGELFGVGSNFLFQLFSTVLYGVCHVRRRVSYHLLTHNKDIGDGKPESTGGEE